MRKIVASVALTLVVLALAAVLFIHSGLYNVAATEAHAPVISWALGTTREHSVRRRARDIPVPPLTADHAQAGSKLYASLCLTCHALPHTEGGELGEGLMPRPPDAGAIARHLAPAEMFWITLNGIRMTCMPAFAGPHRRGRGVVDRRLSPPPAEGRGAVRRP